MSLVVVGSMALDSIETPFENHDDVWGGSATYFSTAASYFTRVELVAVVGNDFPEEVVSFLEGRGVDLAGLTRTDGPTFRWKGRYAYNMEDRETLDTQLGVFEHFDPELPDGYRDAELVFLANIDPDLQRKVLGQVKKPRLVACDTMNFWIEGKLEALKKTLASVDLLIINDGEARQLAGEHNIVRAAKAIREMGPERLIVKRGEYGAMLFDGDHVFVAPAFPLFDVIDPTGAGDSFAGGLMGYLAGVDEVNQTTLRQAMIAGSALASFTCEGFGLDRLRKVENGQIKERIAAFRALTHFEELGDAALSTVA